jgi:hypothetical protein
MMRLFFVISACLSCIHALQPIKGKIYKANQKNPEKDVTKITSTEAIFVSRHWLDDILKSREIYPEDKYIADNINALKQNIQNQYTNHKELDYEFLVWSPNGLTADVLFLIVIEIGEATNTLTMLIHSPFWDSNQISNVYLLRSLSSYSSAKGKKLDIESFLNRNIRYKLCWHPDLTHLTSES